MGKKAGKPGFYFLKDRLLRIGAPEYHSNDCKNRDSRQKMPSITRAGGQEALSTSDTSQHCKPSESIMSLQPAPSYGLSLSCSQKETVQITGSTWDWLGACPRAWPFMLCMPQAPAIHRRGGYRVNEGQACPINC